MARKNFRSMKDALAFRFGWVLRQKNNAFESFTLKDAVAFSGWYYTPIPQKSQRFFEIFLEAFLQTAAQTPCFT